MKEWVESFLKKVPGKYKRIRVPGYYREVSEELKEYRNRGRKQ